MYNEELVDATYAYIKLSTTLIKNHLIDLQISSVPVFSRMIFHKGNMTMFALM